MGVAWRGAVWRGVVWQLRGRTGLIAAAYVQHVPAAPAPDSDAEADAHGSYEDRAAPAAATGSAGASPMAAKKALHPNDGRPDLAKALKIQAAQSRITGCIKPKALGRSGPLSPSHGRLSRSSPCCLACASRQPAATTSCSATCKP